MVEAAEGDRNSQTSSTFLDTPAGAPPLGNGGASDSPPGKLPRTAPPKEGNRRRPIERMQSEGSTVYLDSDGSARLVEGEAALRMKESEGSARLLLSRPSSAELADGELSSPERPSLLSRASAGNAFGERQGTLGSQNAHTGSTAPSSPKKESIWASQDDHQLSQPPSQPPNPRKARRIETARPPGAGDEGHKPSSSLPQGEQRGGLWATAPAGSGAVAAPADRVLWDSPDAEPPLQFAQYLESELNPAPLYPTADAIWGQTERQRVYNAIAYVPYQLERLVWFSMLLCCDSFLAVFTILPVRFCRALHSMGGFHQRGRHRKLKLQGQQLTDVLCVAMFLATFLVLNSLDAGAIYFWMKDLTQEFLKLQVIYTAVEIFDKIACSFAVDSLEALSGTCTLFTSSPNKRNHLGHLVSDFLVTLSLVMFHAVILLCQGMAFSVAMNSKRNHALVGLIIAINFVEMKGTIFKRFDTNKLFVMTCQDVVERFHLCLSLLFVVAEDLANTTSWAPSGRLAWRCCQIFAAEICIDVIKHAVLGKFNEIRPGVYREFLRDVCDKIKSSHSHNIHRVVCFEPFAPAALFLRIMLSLLTTKDSKLLGLSPLRLLFQGVLCISGWCLLCATKVVLGYWLKGAAGAYLRHFERRQKSATKRPPLPRATATGDISKLAKKE